MKRTVFLVTLMVAALISAKAIGQGNYPSRVVHLIVPFSAGGPTDLIARVVAEKMSEIWKFPLIVENRPGVPGYVAVAKAAPDGYTLMLTSNGYTLLKALNKELPFDPIKDFSGIAQIASVPLVLTIASELPPNSLIEFIEYVRAKPGAINFASAGGVSSASFLASSLMLDITKLQMQHIPYKGVPEAMMSVIRNDTQMFFLGVTLASEISRTGKLKALAITSQNRMPLVANIPTMAEAGLPQFRYDTWIGLMAPAGTPKWIVDQVSIEITKVIKRKDVAEKLSQQGVEIAPASPEQFEQIIRDDTKRNFDLLKKAGVTVN